ncbi:VanW family protein [Cohnella sp. WQ 127256]|uniref:VanW family protein n=1 Tax=Cohnella sp. WQ 127256 TaxID=2938790 RepID=UPI002118175D|nr:VanW family protein [Cohnella sp. WQ 127256]
MKKGWLITVLLALVVVGVGAGGAMSYGSDDTLPEDFKVGDLHVGGQSPTDALKKIQQRVDDAENIKVTVQGLDASATDVLSDPTWTLKQLGMKVDASIALKAIQDYEDASWWDRAMLRYRSNIQTNYEYTVTWDDQMLRKEVTASLNSSTGTTAKEATRTINDNDEVVYTSEVVGTNLDLPSLLATIKSFEPKSLTSENNKESNGSGQSTPEMSGAPHTIELPLIRTVPEVTLASLKNEGIDRKIIEFTTSFATSAEGRSHNVTVAAQALNETLLMPDEIFEYGKIVAKAEKEYGYKEAPVILKGKLVPGMGGGICQVSSTLYNAALLTGLDIIERRNHSLVVSYLPKGLDATFADGFVNFKFRNSTGKQLLIRTVVKDKTLTVKLFGTMPGNITYQTESVQVKVNPPKIVYVADENITLGKQKSLQKGDSGYVVESFLIKKIDGEFAERKKLSKDTYRTQDSLIAVNPSDPRLLPEGTTPVPGVKPGTTKEPSKTPAPSGEEIVEPV